MTLNQLIAGYHRGGGSLSGDPLTARAEEIFALMCAQSRGRIPRVEDTDGEARLIQSCFSRMVDAAQELQNPELQSETLGQWHRTYRDSGREKEKVLLGILREYLGETGLLYRGWAG